MAWRLPRRHGRCVYSCVPLVHVIEVMFVEGSRAAAWFKHISALPCL